MATISSAPFPLSNLPHATVPRRSASLEGLRALAALWVVCSHIWISQFGLAPKRGLLGWAANWLLYSHLAVDVFIVLSGYCLSLAVVRDEGLRNGAHGFWRRRARRILPPLYLALALAVGVLLALQWLDGVPRRIDLGALGINVLLLQDLFLKDNAFDSPLWSVAVEWRLSVIFPLLVWLWHRGGAKTLLITTAVVGYGLAALVLRYAPDFLMSCPWYGFLFALGMCAASGVPTRASQGWLGSQRGQWVLGTGTTLTLICLLHAYPVTADGVVFGRHMPLIDAAVGALTAGLLWILGGFSGAPMKAPLLIWEPLVAMGQFSYSLYLTHAPLLCLLERLLQFLPVWTRASALTRVEILMGFGLPLLIGAAYLFFLACERPFISGRSGVYRV